MALMLGKNSGGVLSVTSADGIGSTNLVLPESGTVVTTAEVAVVQSQVDTHISVPTSYHIYNGGVSIDNTVITNGFGTTLYTGNGSTQTVTTNVDMATQWGNDVSETFGGLVWNKSRSGATGHYLNDTVRSIGNYIDTSTNGAQTTNATGFTAFSSTGFSLGALAGLNTSAATYASWNFQTTHRKTGVTNHGKTYTEHYNPYTGFTIIKYTGSGIVGHDIPHSLNRKLAIAHIKSLTTAGYDWISLHSSNFSQFMRLNLTDASGSSSAICLGVDENKTTFLTNQYTNASGNDYIMYGWSNSYYDKNNTLIGNYEIGVYQGTGVAGNKVPTRGKPAWAMIKRLDSTGDWYLMDNLRSHGQLQPNTSATEYTDNWVNMLVDGFSHSGTHASFNTSGGQYLYMVVYDNDSGSGKSKYPKATDTTNVNINALVPYANGIDTAGSKVSISYKNETISGLTLTQGKNYPYSKNDGTYGANKYEPMYGALRDRSVAGENPDYFDLKTNKWYATTGGNELVTNGTFDVDTSRWTGVNASLSVSYGGLSIYCNAAYGNAYQLIPTTTGKTYRIKGQINSNIGASAFVQAETSLGLYNLLNYNTTTTGNFDLTFVAQTTTTYIKLQAGASAGNSAIFDNISVFELIPTIGAEIPPRTYLDCIVYADHNGQPEYTEELAKTVYFDMIESANNRVVMYLSDYGISQVQTNKRYILTNPFGNDKAIDCEVKAELYLNGYWGESGFDGNSGYSSNGYGTKATVTSNGIIIQTGSSGVCTDGYMGGGSWYSGVSSLASAPCRVIVTYKGKTRGQK